MVVSNYPVVRWLGNDPSQQVMPDEDTYWPLWLSSPTHVSWGTEVIISGSPFYTL